MSNRMRRTSAQSAPSWAGPELTVALVAGGIVALLILVVGLVEGALSSSQALAATFAGLGLLGLSVGFRTTPLDLDDVAESLHRPRRAHRASAPRRGTTAHGQRPHGVAP